MPRNAYFARRYAAPSSHERRKVVDILAELDGQRACVYCGGRHDLTIDHVVPESRLAEFRLPRDVQNNKVLACKPCNWKKHDKTPAEAGYDLQPWVRRRTWILRLYAGWPIGERTPTGAVIDPALRRAAPS